MSESSQFGKAYTAMVLGKLLEAGRIHRITDVGPGSGTYRRLLASAGASAHWTAVEVWAPYVDRFGLKTLYDEVVVSNAVQFDFAASAPDLVLFGDVLEHMTKDEAVGVVGRAVQAASLVMVSIPVAPYPQDELEGNPFERHVKEDWSHAEVIASFDHIVTAAIHDYIGVYFITGDLGWSSEVRALHGAVSGAMRARPDMFADFFAS